jgi:hypothetical protein
MDQNIDPGRQKVGCFRVGDECAAFLVVIAEFQGCDCRQSPITFEAKQVQLTLASQCAEQTSMLAKRKTVHTSPHLHRSSQRSINPATHKPITSPTQNQVLIRHQDTIHSLHMRHQTRSANLGVQIENQNGVRTAIGHKVLKNSDRLAGSIRGAGNMVDWELSHFSKF